MPAGWISNRRSDCLRNCLSHHRHRPAHQWGRHPTMRHRRHSAVPTVHADPWGATAPQTRQQPTGDGGGRAETEP